MAFIGLLFELSTARTVPGQEIRVTGSVPELGDWDPDRADNQDAKAATNVQQLHTNTLSYPCWAQSSPVWLKCTEEEEPEGEDDSHWSSPRVDLLSGANRSNVPGAGILEIEYKYVKETLDVRRGGRPAHAWEDCIPNRRVRVPTMPGTIWLISDVAWNSKEPCRLTQIMQPEVISRCYRLNLERSVSQELPELRSVCLTECGSEFTYFDIEDEFEALERAKSSTSKLANEASQDLAKEVLELRRENAKLRIDKESVENEMRCLQQELAWAKAKAAESAQTLLVSLQSE